MTWLSHLNACLTAIVLVLARLCLAGLGIVVLYGVVMRYAFNNEPPYVEQLALLLVISVSMFGAAAGVRDAGHIGMDSLVRALPAKAQFWCRLAVEVISIGFAVSLIAGGFEMALSTHGATIPTLGLSEAYRYLPVIIAGVLIVLFALEHLVAQFTGRKVVSSWH